MSENELVSRLVAQIRAKNSSTFYLNGPPASGKSYLLSRLAERLPGEIPQSLVLGPYAVTGQGISSLAGHLVRDFWNAAYLDAPPPSELEHDLVTVWRWLGENAYIPPGQTFLVLVDLVEPIHHALATHASLFSTIRYLEGAWSLRGVRLLHLCAGLWDPPELECYYDSINTSHPYTIGHNYLIWEGVSREDMVTLIRDSHSDQMSPLHGRLLFELTGGHPGAAKDILAQLTPGNFGFSALLSSTYKAAVGGATGRSLVEAWASLPSESKSVLKSLLLRRCLPAGLAPSYLERLRAFGLVRVDRVGAARYLRFRSWYVEVLARLYAQEIGIEDPVVSEINIAELMPEVNELNMEAYLLIRDIESQVRNFVTVHLCLKQGSDSVRMLEGWGKQYNDRTNSFEDAHQRAQDWQARSARRGLPTHLNPLLAYLSTRDLADLVIEVGTRIESKAWQRIAQAMRDLAAIRDAVMHNQFIDDPDLQRLYNLRSSVYEALAAAKENP